MKSKCFNYINNYNQYTIKLILIKRMTQKFFDPNKNVFSISEPANINHLSESPLAYTPIDNSKNPTNNVNIQENNSIEKTIKIAGKRRDSETKENEEILNEKLTTQAEIEGKTPGRWTENEHKLFLEGLNLYGKNWKMIENHVGTRTSTQIRSHAQKYQIKINKELGIKNQDSSSKEIQRSDDESKNLHEIKNDIPDQNNPPPIISPLRSEPIFRRINCNYASPNTFPYFQNNCFDFNYVINSLQNLFNYFYQIPFEEARLFLNDLKSISISLKNLNYGNFVILNKYIRQIECYINIHDFNPEAYQMLYNKIGQK